MWAYKVKTLVLYCDEFLNSYAEVANSLYEFTDSPLSKISINCGFISFCLYQILRGKTFSNHSFQAIKLQSYQQCLVFLLEKYCDCKFFSKILHHPGIITFETNRRFNFHSLLLLASIFLEPRIRARCFDFIFTEFNYCLCSQMFFG